MPGFFQSLKRIAKGEPVYRPEEHDGPILERPVAQEAPAEAIGAKQPSGHKILPRVVIEDYDDRPNGERVEYWAYIRNDSEYDIFLDKITILGVKRELDATLSAGERQQFLIFSDRKPTNKYNKCELQYRDLEGDYFIGLHDIDSRKRDDDEYYIHRIKYMGLKDI